MPCNVERYLNSHCCHCIFVISQICGKEATFLGVICDGALLIKCWMLKKPEVTKRSGRVILLLEPRSMAGRLSNPALPLPESFTHFHVS